MSAGSLVVAGLGPGADAFVTPAVTAALAAATDIFGYAPYVARVAPRDGLTLHASDNREELARAGDALALACAGAHVVIVSSGDPGVFAMAAAVFEAIEAGPAAWRHVDVQILPGITAMLAASAAAGAPLGHDFCAINLSDNLKPQALIDRRVRLAAEADFVIAFYNPRSVARPDGLDRALATIRAATAGPRLVLFARAIATPAEALRIEPLDQARGDMADMRTLVIVGSSSTRLIERPGRPYLYTPRSAA
jgi:precorrin-3B C17-methyltransferase